MQRPDIVTAIKSMLRQIAPHATVILYGSEARGDARPDSDIDLLILVDREKISLEEQQAITYPLYDIEVAMGVLINPIVLPRTSWENVHRITPFYHNVMKEGIVL
jgi:predicted nucleotidyltransferase